MPKDTRPTKITFDGDDVVTVDWDVRLGRLSEGYARGGDYQNGKIRIAGFQTRNGMRSALFHEVGHHAWARAGLDQWLSDQTEELVMSELLAWMLDTLRSNPDMVAFLFEED